MGKVDVAIIGAGAAGMTAALYAKRQGLSIALLERGSAGGTTSNAVDIENYPGAGKVRGKELMSKFVEQLQSAGVEVQENRRVEMLKKATTGAFEVYVGGEKEKISAESVVLATGSEHRKLGVKGEGEFFGKGVSYCVVCDGPFFKGKEVAVIGGGSSGAVSALFLAGICQKVHIIEFMPQLMCEDAYKKAIGENAKKGKISLHLGSETTEILGKNKVVGIKCRDRTSGEESTISAEGVFIYVGVLPNSGLAKQVGADLDKKGHVKVDSEQRTSIPGLFAAGDVTARAKQVCVASGDGAVAALSAYAQVKGPQT